MSSEVSVSTALHFALSQFLDSILIMRLSLQRERDGWDSTTDDPFLGVQQPRHSQPHPHQTSSRPVPAPQHRAGLQQQQPSTRQHTGHGASTQPLATDFARSLPAAYTDRLHDPAADRAVSDSHHPMSPARPTRHGSSFSPAAPNNLTADTNAASQNDLRKVACRAAALASNVEEGATRHVDDDSITGSPGMSCSKPPCLKPRRLLHLCNWRFIGILHLTCGCFRLAFCCVIVVACRWHSYAASTRKHA